VDQDLDAAMPEASRGPGGLSERLRRKVAWADVFGAFHGAGAS
jgi:hypothetical protein